MFKLSKQIITETLAEFPEIRPYLSKKALKAADSFLAVLEGYYQTVYEAVSGYLSSSRPVTAFRNLMASTMAETFTQAAYSGYQEAGGELPLDEETSKWLSERIAGERVNIDSLFERLRDKVRSGEVFPETIEYEATSRAQGYSNTLDAVYQEARMRGSKNKTLIFVGDDGKESCPECKKLKNKRHRISWIVEKEMIPMPGNGNFTCQGYNCHHYWMDPLTGEAYTF